MKARFLSIPAMRLTPIARALRQAALMGLASPPLVASGCAVAGSSQGDSGAPSYITCLSSDASGVDVSLPQGCSVAVDMSIPGDVCGEDYLLAGPATACDPRATGDFNTELDPALCVKLCPPLLNDGSAENAATCQVFGNPPAPDGGSLEAGLLQCAYPSCCHGGGGRRPEGLLPIALQDVGSVAAFLAEQAYLEEASVGAFERLTGELTRHRAPSRLRAGSRRAARDEVRHARVMRRLALRAGAVVPAVRSKPSADRCLEAMAVENAVEGCVRETYGAAVAVMQATQAQDGRIRSAMQRIALDEVRHSELAWGVMDWIVSRLDGQALRRVREAALRAMEELRTATSLDPNAVVSMDLGVPSAAQAQALIEHLQKTLWSTFCTAVADES